MKSVIKTATAGLLLAGVLSACGQTSGPLDDHGAMPGMNGSMPLASAETNHNMPGMSHGDSEADNAPYDARFIDSMIEHHTGAIVMAEEALQQSERPEIRQLAEAIIRDQQREVEQMQGWRKQWYPDLAATSGMGMEMGDMTVGGDANAPYDQRFITAMIAHHNSAIAMAQDALTKAERPEVRQLAEAIIKAQEAENAQMQQWQRDWFGE